MSSREEFEEYRDDAANNIKALATATSQRTYLSLDAGVLGRVAWNNTECLTRPSRHACVVVVVCIVCVAAHDELVTNAEGFISETERVVCDPLR